MQRLSGSNWPIHGKGGRKRRPLTQFSASFPHPIQDISPTALNVLAAAPGRQIYRHLALGARITTQYFVEPPHPFQKQAPLILLTESPLGSLRILAASRILFKGRVRPLPVEDEKSGT
jgi:hypothetical protein